MENLKNLKEIKGIGYELKYNHMDVEHTIRFLTETAASHDARLAEMEKNNVLIQEALLRLVEHESETRNMIRDVGKELRELGKKTDERIGKLVSAMAKLSHQRPN
jgi:hypothetical protein